MHRNLLYSLIALILICGGLYYYSSNKAIVPETFITKRGALNITLDSSFKDIYSARYAPEGTLFMRQSTKKDITVLVNGSVVPPNEKDITLEERADIIKQELENKNILLDLDIIDGELYYSMTVDEHHTSYCRLNATDSLILVTSIVSNNDIPKETIDTILASIVYNDPT